MKEIILNTVNPKSPNYRKHKAMVDDEDFEKVNQHKWSVKTDESRFYAQGWINGKIVSMHIFIMGFRGIDHKDNNGLNNQKENLRKATVQQNAMNTKSYKNSTSKYKGVSWKKDKGKWRAVIMFNGKQVFIGYFTSDSMAAIAYNEKAVVLFGPFAKLNQI